jgi:SAM-dependent methyltransferase
VVDFEVIREAAVRLSGGSDYQARAAVEYAERVVRTYGLMKPHLPAAASSVLDVGCGMGGNALALGLHYDRVPALYLLDGRQADAVEGGGRKARHPGYKPYDPEQRPWNDAEKPAALFRVMGFKAHALPADPEATCPVEVVVSTRSWGHHYPVDVYLPLVLRSLRPGGVVFLDVRNGTDGLAKMSEHFRLLATATTSPTDKCTFAAFTR